jgi:hypothetical protein
MTFDHGCIEDHEKYLAKVPRAVLRKRLDVFRLKEEVIEALPFICLSLDIREPFSEYRQWLHPLDPISLDDLKNWFGVPNEAAKQLSSESRALAIRGNLCVNNTHDLPRALPMMNHYEFEALDSEQRLAVQQAANSLLYGYVDPDEVERPPLLGVINYMLASAQDRKLRIFVAPDLIVCPKNVVKFKNIPALFFNNILVYGGGKIVTQSKTSIHAYQIRHIDV